MALQSCYECNKEISTKAIMCPQCGAPQNPVSGLLDKATGFLSKNKKAFMSGVEEAKKEKKSINEMTIIPISGNGIRLSCVAYCDDGIATLGVKGKVNWS